MYYDYKLIFTYEVNKPKVKLNINSDASTVPPLTGASLLVQNISASHLTSAILAPHMSYEMHTEIHNHWTNSYSGENFYR